MSTGTWASRMLHGGRSAGLAMVVVATLVGGCKKGDSTSGSGKAASEPPKEVRIGYFANATHAQGVLGVSSGDFEKAVAPSKFSTKVFNAGPSLIEALFANEIDIGYIGPGPALNGFAKSKGKGVRVIAGSAGSGVLIVARKGSNITKLEDLAGKKIATPQLGNTQDIAAKHFLTNKFKIDPSGVTAVPNAEQAGLMSRGQIDASWAPEPWGSYLVAETGATVVAEEKSLWPEGNFSITVVISTPEFLAQHPDVVEKVLGVHVKWTDRLNAEPEKWLPDLDAALLKLTNKKLPQGVLKSAIGRTTFSEEPLAHTFKAFTLWAYELKFANELTDIKDLVDTTILKKVRAATPAPTSPTTGSSPATAPAK